MCTCGQMGCCPHSDPKPSPQHHKNHLMHPPTFAKLPLTQNLWACRLKFNQSEMDFHVGKGGVGSAGLVNKQLLIMLKKRQTDGWIISWKFNVYVWLLIGYRYTCLYGVWHEAICWGDGHFPNLTWLPWQMDVTMPPLLHASQLPS